MMTPEEIFEILNKRKEYNQEYMNWIGNIKVEIKAMIRNEEKLKVEIVKSSNRALVLMEKYSSHDTDKQSLNINENSNPKLNVSDDTTGQEIYKEVECFVNIHLSKNMYILPKNSQDMIKLKIYSYKLCKGSDYTILTIIGDDKLNHRYEINIHFSPTLSEYYSIVERKGYCVLKIKSEAISCNDIILKAIGFRFEKINDVRNFLLKFHQ
uniref:Uncharacterized protein n=1 Tax=Parastrongyloides trichosuri TaxID=131310 RepID=A0A0N4Z0V8_PARTI